MKRIAQALLIGVVLALIAADPPNTPKPVPRSDSAGNRETAGEATTGAPTPPPLRDDSQDVAALKRFGILLVANQQGNIVTACDDSLRTVVDPADWMPHLKGLPALWSLSFQRHFRTTDAHMAFLKDLTGLRELRIEQSRISDAGLANLEGLRDLVSLSLSYDAKVTDAGLAHLRGLTKIRDLDLSRTGISDSGLRELKDMQGLQRLDLTRTRITDDGLVLLKDLRMLRTLRCAETKVTGAGELALQETRLWPHWRLAPAPGAEAMRYPRPNGQAAGGAAAPLDDAEAIAFLDRFACLTLVDGHVDKVYIIGTADPAKLASCLKRLPKLRALWLPGRAADSFMPLVKDLPGLKDLTACYGDLTDAGLANLEGAGEILRLDLRGSKGITGAGLAHLRALTKLSRLYLAQTSVDDAALENLKGLEALEYLDLSNTEVAGPGLEHLQGLRALRSLDLSQTKVADRGLKYVSRLTQLEGLRLGSTGITDAGLVYLMSMSHLKGLVCAGTKVTKTGAKPLIARHPSTSVAVADGTWVSADSYVERKEPTPDPTAGNPTATADERDAIAALRSRGSTVSWNRHRDLYSVVIAPGIYPVFLLPYLKRLPRLSELELAHATDSQIAIIKDLPRLTSITAWGGEISDAGLANLEGAADLQMLDLSANMGITGAGLARLRPLKKLTSLKLAFTRVDDAGLKNLTEMKQLRLLDVTRTKVTKRGLQYVPQVRVIAPDLDLTDVPRDELRAVRDLYGLDSHASDATHAGTKPSNGQPPTRKIIVWDGEGILGAHVVEEPEVKASDKEKGAKPAPKPRGP